MFELPPLESIPQRTWSDLQIQVFDAVKNPDVDILVEAVAGGAKTTTAVEAMHHAPGRTLFMAFNKAIAEEIKSRVRGTEVKTLNALGHALWRGNENQAELDARKVPQILQKLMKPTDYKEYGWTTSRIVGLMKNNAFGVRNPIDVQDVEDLIESYQLEIPAEVVNGIAQVAHRALLESISDQRTFDFDDQLYMPVLSGWTFPRYDNVFVDECQDLSPIQHLMLESLATRGARIVAVGDRHQAIYGFRGAMSNSMDALKAKFEMLELPLSITYRCCQKIVEEAQLYVPQIQAAPNAPEGEVFQLDEDPTLFNETMIVCRNNAPLFRAILAHVRQKVPCRVLSNFIEAFEGFIRHFKADNCRDLLVKLDDWYKTECEAAEKKGFHGKIAALTDKYETTRLLATEFKLVSELIAVVKKLAESTTGPTFATIHKAKGLEHERVFILRPDLMPSRFATSPEALQQEANLTYVAITRGKGSLTYGARW